MYRHFLKILWVEFLFILVYTIDKRMLILLKGVSGVLYITDIHALNLPCTLDTCGDWHTSAIQWEHPHIRESEGSLFGNYGIEKNKAIPEHTENYNVANHIRAILDLLEEGKFSIAQGMNRDFICNDKYDEEVFDKVYTMKNLRNWQNINDFMKKEYMMKWVNYLKQKAG